ncbi:carboxymuconolactone decarboxylase family protein [Streptomyces sp. NPDC050560]|uniref:carboxymuconolactone decarboxylase family protein n=1 Tax=Streptomyces sp. NPDC050560 TaxID=3365630 RepID=UPI0037B875C0
MSSRTQDGAAPPPRLPRLAPGGLTREQERLYRTITEGPRRQHAGFFPVADGDGVLSGPYRAMLLSPDVGTALEAVGVAVRYHSALPARERELAILMVSCHCRCPVEWRAHEELARAAGVPGETVDTLRSGAPTLPDRPAQVLYAFVGGLLGDNRVPDETFREAESLWSTAGVFELVVTVGYYQIIAGINNAFDVSSERKGPA